MPLQSSLPFDGSDIADAPAALAGRLALPVPDGHRDELRLPDGTLREPWARFFGILDDLRPAARAQRTARAGPSNVARNPSPEV